MNNFLFILFFVFVSTENTFAQNILPNPGFEDFDLCPTYSSQINRCAIWDSAYGTADYYNCSYYGPSPLGDYGIAYAGTGVVGFLCAPPSNFPPYNRFYGESFQAPLLETLIPGAQYVLKAQIMYNLVNQPSPASDCFDLGFYFFKTGNLPPFIIGDCPAVNPQVRLPGNVISLGFYTEYVFNYIADSCFDNVMIGFFCNDSTSTSTCKLNASTFYYDIDNVSLQKIADATLRVSGFTSSKQTLCSGNCISFSDTSLMPSTTYEWLFDGGLPSSSHVIHPQQICYPKSGTYDVTMITHFECSSDTITKSNYIVVNDNPTLDIIADSMPQCFGVPITLFANSNSNSTVTWSDGSVSPTLTVTKEGNYSATATNSCTIVFDEIKVDYIECPCTVFYPNAFSPNHDGKNEKFDVIVQCETQSFQIKIWNRWGQEMFSTNDPKISWDGMYDGKACEEGIYTMILQYRGYIGERLKTVSQKGMISLIR